VHASTVALTSFTVIGLIAASGLGVLYFQTAGQVSSQQQTIGSLQLQVANVSGQLDNLKRSTVTSTTTATVTTIQVSTSTTVTTSLITTTKTLFPPSDSTYALTYVDGNATITEPSCGSFVVAVYVNYAMYAQLSSNSLVQWARFPSGQVMQPNTQKVFTNQADMTVASTYNYSTNACSVGMIQNLAAFVTDSNNNQLSPSTNFVVLKR
jgi:hypothetical protein